MNRTLAPIQLVVGCLVTAAVLYACFQMSKVAELAHPFGQAPADEETPVPLEEAAPEAVRHREAFRALVARCRFFVAACLDRTGDYPVVRGKALIWDAATNDLSEAHRLLPADIRAPDPSGPVVVFLITKQDRHAQANYNYDMFSGGGPTGVRGFRTDTWLSVIAMPGQQPLGRFRVAGNDPPSALRIQPGQTEVDGNWKGPVAYWVESCIRGPKWREKERFPKIPAEHEGFAQLAEQASQKLPQCQAKGAAGTFPKVPAKALIWDWQPKVLLNRLNAAQTHLPADRQADPNDREVLVVLVIGSKYIREHFGAPPDKGVDRIDYTVALVVMPSQEAARVFTVRGEEWPEERRRKLGDGPDPNQTMARWVTRFLEAPHAITHSR
jgi:hypothetical protein